MVTLILKEGLTYLFIIVYIATMRVELAIVRGVTMRLNIVCLSRHASVYRSRLTCGSV